MKIKTRFGEYQLGENDKAVAYDFVLEIDKIIYGISDEYQLINALGLYDIYNPDLSQCTYVIYDDGTAEMLTIGFDENHNEIQKFANYEHIKNQLICIYQTEGEIYFKNKYVTMRKIIVRIGDENALNLNITF